MKWWTRAAYLGIVSLACGMFAILMMLVCKAFGASWSWGTCFRPGWLALGGLALSLVACGVIANHDRKEKVHENQEG